VFGTPYAFELTDKLLFLEGIAEQPYRVDRIVQQLLLSAALRGARAIVLGTFTDCADRAPEVYASRPKGKKRKMMPLRKTLSATQVLSLVFGELGETLGIPVFHGLPVGHGQGPATLELGVECELRGDGTFLSTNGSEQ